MIKIGLDIGSTTVKAVALDEKGNVVFEDYRRHMSKITEMSAAMLRSIAEKTGEERACLSITGSAAMGFAEKCSLDFVQEVYATKVSVDKHIQDIVSLRRLA